MTETSIAKSKSKTDWARSALLKRLIDTVAMPASSISFQDRHLASDILLDMLFEASDQDRALCAKRLRVSTEAPRRLMRYLAQCQLDVARPLLEENTAFDSSDLREIVEGTGVEHQLLVAARRNLSAVVSEALIDQGEVQVLRALLNNKGAEISEASIDKMVTLSQQHDEFCSLLVNRRELTPSQAMAMFWWSDGQTRKAILSKYSADRMILVNICSDVFAMMKPDDWKDPVARKALQLIERRQRNRAALERSHFESLETAISVAAANGMTPEVMQEIGYLAGIRPVCMAKLVSDLGGEGLAVLCKATGLKRPAVVDLWKAMRRPVHLDEDQMHPQLKYVMTTFDELSVMKAQTVLRYWNWSLTAAGIVGSQPANDSEQRDEFSASKRTTNLVFGS